MEIYIYLLQVLNHFQFNCFVSSNLNEVQIAVSVAKRGKEIETEKERERKMEGRRENKETLKDLLTGGRHR